MLDVAAAIRATAQHIVAARDALAIESARPIPAAVAAAMGGLVARVLGDGELWVMNGTGFVPSGVTGPVLDAIAEFRREQHGAVPVPEPEAPVAPGCEGGGTASCGKCAHCDPSTAVPPPGAACACATGATRHDVTCAHATEATAEPGGTWVAVRPDDPRIVDGESRVRLNGSEGTAGRYGTPRLYATNPGREAWMSHHEDGPDVELWVPAERTLPLPTEPGPFWGRVELSSVTTWTGWILYAPESSDPRPYVTPVLVGGDDFHGAHRVTHLPVPADELAALHARLGVQS